MIDEIIKENKVALYLRVSTDEQTKDDHYGIKIQEEKGRSFCESQEGYVLKEEHIYKDEGVSGGLSIEKRPALKRLFEDARERKFNIVLVYKIDRMARNLRVLLNGLEELKEIGIDFRSITEPFDTSSAFGESTVQMVGLFAQLERKLIQERTTGGRESAARDGKWVMGLPPFSYKRDKTTGGLEIIPVEARAVKQFFKWVVDDKLSLREVQRRANNSNLPAPKHRVYKKKHTLNYWHKRTINRILTNEVYTGTTYYRKFKRQKSRYLDSLTNKKYQRPVEEWIEIKVPPIITPELFEETRRQLLRNRDFARRNQKRNYLYSKIVHCGVCGFKMFGGYQPDRNGQERTDDTVGKYYHGTYRKADEPGKTQRCQTCKNYAESRLEPVWDTLKEILKQPKIVFSLSEEYTTKQTNKKEINDQLNQVQQELETIENKRKRLTEVYVEDHGFTSDEYNRRKKELDIEEDNLKNERIKLNQFLLSKKEQVEREKSIKKLYNTIKAQLDNFTYDEKVSVVRLFVNKISLLADENVADVIYQFPTDQLIPVFGSEVWSLKDNHNDGVPIKSEFLGNNRFDNVPSKSDSIMRDNSGNGVPIKTVNEPIIMRDNSCGSSPSKIMFDSLENNRLDGCFSKKNSILWDNHP